MKKYLYIAAGAFVVWALITQWRLTFVKAKLKQSEANHEQALEFANGLKLEVTRYKGNLDHAVLRVKGLILSKENLERMLSGKLKEVSNLKAKIKNVEAVTMTTTVIDPFQMEPSDTVYLNTCEAFHYKYRDEFNAIDVLAIDTPRMKIVVPVYGIPHKLRRKILGLRIGKLDMWFDAWSPNKLVTMDSTVYMKTEK